MWDDHVMIEMNPWIRSWSVPNLKHDFLHDVFDGHGDLYYRPAQTLSDRVDYTLWKLNPFGYHLTNLTVHAVNAVLLSELLLALGFLPMTALLTGCLFAVHPIVVEQIMIIAGRAELFGLCFGLISLLFLLQEGPSTLLLASGACLIALLFKESSIILSALGALSLYFKNSPRKSYWRLSPLIVLSFPYMVLRHHVVGPLFAQSNPFFILRFFIQAFPKVMLRYAGLILFPWNLHSHRMMPRLTHFWPVLLVALSGLILWAVKKDKRLWLFCIGWFILCLLPKTPVMIYGNFMLDHWAYPASLAILLPIALFFTKVWEQPSQTRSRTLALLFFPFLIGWALLARLNIELRGTDEKMYRWALHFTESHPIKYNLGILLLQTNRPAEAIPYFYETMLVYPNDLNNRHALAIAYWQTGHTILAAKLLRQILQENPSFQPALQSLAAIERLSPGQK